MMLQIDEDHSPIVKMVAFGMLAFALLYRPRFHRLAVLLLPLAVSMLLAATRSFDGSAAAEEMARFVFPVVITMALYAYRTSLRPVVIAFVTVVVSNDLFQCYAYAVHIAGLPAFITERIDSGLYLRAQGWIGFFSEFSFMNFCAFVLCRHYWRTRQARRAGWLFLVFAVLGLSFKLSPVLVAYFLVAHKNSLRAYAVAAITAIAATAVAISGLLDKLFGVAATKMSLYLIAGNSARAESYRVMGDSLLKGNFLGEGLGSFGGPASVKYNSPLYSTYNFKWYGMQGVLKTTDTFYPHLFVELGICGALVWLAFVLLYGQHDRRATMWRFMAAAIAFDNVFSMSFLSASYIFSAVLTMYLFSQPKAATATPNSGAAIARARSRVSLAGPTAQSSRHAS
ncbi:hypothetical protein [Paraburkholderia sp. BL6665CI2N2]|uniref:hypothetical protein n=1 Tax=Paraburkholderia sp. BL6665CI2N2 TaxID=1938806 RepID=UPI0010651FD2|nr:hypothetical protein [Paraburkholderia sp. BL6665CI2N2]